MITRFQGADGRRRLIAALADQKLVLGDQLLAERLADRVELSEAPAGTVIIEQDDATNDLYFILVGSFDVAVNSRVVNRRQPNDHVGEMAAIEPRLRRSATLVATEPAVVAKLSEPHLSQIGDEFPKVWRTLARVLATRLSERNALVPASREAIRVFLIRSAEALPIARAIENSFEHDPFKIMLWTHGTFRASSYPVESLEAELDRSDFAIAIAHPDDITQSRDATSPSPRDNVIFELGMFIGRLGRKRSFLLEPRDEKVKLPSDLSGITTLPYRFEASEPERTIAPVCNRMRTLFQEMGAKQQTWV